MGNSVGDMEGLRDHAEEIAHHTAMLEAYQKGARAKRHGLDTVDCPYRPNSDAGKEWFEGYKEAERCC